MLTLFFLAILNPTDDGHRRSVELSRSLKSNRITTAWVLTKVADAMALPGNRSIFSEFLKTLERSPLVTILPPSETLFRQGLDLYGKRPDKAWTLTDCISFVVMEQEGLREALTGDNHFTQAGYTALLAPASA